MEHSVTTGKPDCAVTPEETPARKVIRLFGSARASALAGLTTEAIRKWDRRLSKGGQGGLVPSRFQKIYLDAAESEGLQLTAEDFMAEPRP